MQSIRLKKFQIGIINMVHTRKNIINKKLKQMIGKTIEVTFEEGFLSGYEPKCKLLGIHDNFIEVDNCDYGEKHQFFNLNKVDRIAIVKDLKEKE